MDENAKQRLRGLHRLVHDGVHRGATSVEKPHRQTVARTAKQLAQVEALAAPVAVVQRVVEASITVNYESVRLVNRAVERADGWALERWLKKG